VDIGNLTIEVFKAQRDNLDTFSSLQKIGFMCYGQSSHTHENTSKKMRLWRSRHVLNNTLLGAKMTTDYTQFKHKRVLVERKNMHNI